MYYEIYIDSLLLINFVMNLYCLELTNLFFLRTASYKRVVFGAALGAFLYLIPFLVPGQPRVKLLIMFPICAVAMLLSTFRIRNMRALLKAFGIMLLTAFLLGGGMLFLVRILPVAQRWMNRIWGVMGSSGLIFLAAAHIAVKEKHQELYQTELSTKGAKITVMALLDTGNGLTEPVSGKPVCILEKSVFDSLWQSGGPEGFRIIPYHSVGRKNGIMYGYLIPLIKVERNGMLSQFQDVYVGVVSEPLTENGGYRMILHPGLFEGKKRWRKQYDHKSVNTGKDASENGAAG